MTSSRVEARLRTALQAGSLATAFWRGVRGQDGALDDLELVEYSEGFRTWIGREDLEPGQRYSQLIPTGIHDRLPLYLEVLEGGGSAQVVVERPGPDGRVMWAEVRVVGLGDDELFAIVWDVSGREHRLRAAEDQARAQHARRVSLEHALEALPVGVALLTGHRDASGAVERMTLDFVNRITAAWSGQAADSWAGMDVEAALPSLRHLGLWEPAVRAMDEGSAVEVSFSFGEEDAWEGAYRATIAPFERDRVVIILRPEGDVPAIDGSRMRVDPVTGVLSKSAFVRLLSDRLAGRSDAAPAEALVLIDVDDFGRLNDVVGRAAADRVLVLLAEGLQAMTPPLDLVARTDADGFAFILPGPITEDRVEVHRAQMDGLMRSISQEAGGPPIWVSGGYRELEPGMTAELAMRDADTALRASVMDGGSRLTRFDQGLRHRMHVGYHAGEDIRAAIGRGEFALAFQPIVSVESGMPIGEEALLRWRHPDLGLVPPSDFIPVAEANGSIVELGAWVIGDAIADLRDRGGNAAVSINVSGVQLLDSDVPRLVAQELERTQVVPSRIIVEITESAIVPDSRRIRDQLAELQRMGVRVAVDDFGSGYSSIAYLDRIPVDLVKLDRYFLDGLLDRRRRTVVAATAQLIRSIGARSLAEGVETDEQWQAVVEAGIDYAQGYLLGRPAFRE